MPANISNAILDFFYPPRCLVCQRVGTQLHLECRPELPFMLPPLCLQCGLSQPPSLNRCYSTLCQLEASKIYLDGLISVFWHKKAAREGVLKLKYKGVSSLSNFLVSELAGAAQRNGLTNANGILPVPLHRNRFKERGYNQAELLGRGLASYLAIPFYPGILKRTGETRSQVGLDGFARQANVRDAFNCESPGQVAGNFYLLVDDVCTTGATLNECARVLKRAGAKRVTGLTVTRDE